MPFACPEPFSFKSNLLRIIYGAAAQTSFYIVPPTPVTIDLLRDGHLTQAGQRHLRMGFWGLGMKDTWSFTL